MTDKQPGRDWLRVSTNPQRVGRVLTKTPHEIAVIVTHQEISYGRAIEECDRERYVIVALKRAIFSAVKDTILEHSV